jgi:mono/diheme cytochrome c family protein
MSRRPGALALAAVAAGALAASGSLGQPSDPSPGARVFREQCAVCHGDAGDGRGHAAHHFQVPPRDFTKGRYKVRSTASGQVPTDDDLRRTIVRGLPGTGMVPQDQLTDADVSAVIAYIKGLSPRFAQAAAPKVMSLPPATGRTPEAVARGARAYVKGECAECHGKEARGDGPSAKDLSVRPSDLTRRPFKGGSTPADIVRTLLTGFDGTPMPSYHQVLEDDELWDLAYWIESLGSAPVVTADEREGWHVVRMHQGRQPVGRTP